MAELLKRKEQLGEDILGIAGAKKKKAQHLDGKVAEKLLEEEGLARLKNVAGKETFKQAEVLAERKRKWVGEKGEFERKDVRHWAHHMEERDFQALLKARHARLAKLAKRAP